MIGTHDPLSRLVLHIALLIWKSCLESIYWVIFMNFKFHDLSTFCLLDNWSQKWVKLILYLVTCCACENEVMHITAMTCIHIVEAKYQITVQVHFKDNIAQILTFWNIILIFHMSFPNGKCLIMCGKCTIFRYFRHSHLCENLHLQFFNPFFFKKMWWILTGVYQCRWFFSSHCYSWRLDLCLVWPQKANIGHKENGSLSSMKSSPTAQQFFLRKKIIRKLLELKMLDLHVVLTTQ